MNISNIIKLPSLVGNLDGGGALTNTAIQANLGTC